MKTESKPSSLSEDKLEPRPDPNLFKTALDVSNLEDKKAVSQIVQGAKEESKDEKGPF